MSTGGRPGLGGYILHGVWEPGSVFPTSYATSYVCACNLHPLVNTSVNNLGHTLQIY